MYWYIHTNKQFLSPRLQVTNMDRIERINAHNTWIQVQMCLLGVSMMINYLYGSRPSKKPKFWGRKYRHFKPILPKIQIPIFKIMYRISTKLTGQRKDFVGGPIWWYKNSKMADGRHLEFRFLVIISASINITGITIGGVRALLHAHLCVGISS